MRIKTFKSKKISAFLLGILLIIIGTICVLFKINSNNKMEKSNTIEEIDNAFNETLESVHKNQFDL